PILPGVVCLGAALAERASVWATGLKLLGALSSSLVALSAHGASARRVGENRRALIDRARTLMVGCHRAAALDVGWVGAAADCAVLDLAGLTDPQIAALPGGHTSKKIPLGLLEARGVDVLVLLLA